MSTRLGDSRVILKDIRKARTKDAPAMALRSGFPVPFERLLPIGRTGDSPCGGSRGTPYVPAPVMREAFRVAVVALRSDFEATNPGIKRIPWEQ